MARCVSCCQHVQRLYARAALCRRTGSTRGLRSRAYRTDGLADVLGTKVAALLIATVRHYIPFRSHAAGMGMGKSPAMTHPVFPPCTAVQSLIGDGLLSAMHLLGTILPWPKS